MFNMTTETEEEMRARIEQTKKMNQLMFDLEKSVEKMNRSAISRGRIEGVVYTLGGLALAGLIAWGIKKK